MDGVLISLDTVSRKIATLRALPEIEFSQLKKVKNIEGILPRLVVLEQTLITFGYREMRVFERELGMSLIVERASNKGEKPPGTFSVIRQETH